MKTLTLFWAVLILLAFPNPVFAIEIVVNGTSYTSIEAYKASKNGLPKAELKPYKPATAKTIELTPPAPISKSTAKTWKTIGYENSVKRVVADFEQNWDNPMPKFRIASDELEDRFKALLDGRTQPLMVVSEANKLRIMELDKNKAVSP